MNSFPNPSRKSSVDEIRARFDRDVERFSDLQLGQQATIDAALAMNLVAHAAATTTPHATHLLDVGCGAGNYTLKLLERIPALSVTLVDLSQPMLDRARERTVRAGAREITTVQADVRSLDFGVERFDIILAAAVLHHFRSEAEWTSVFQAFHAALRPGGSLWIFDLVAHEVPAVHDLMWNRYGEYLSELGGDDYRNSVFAYIEQEDTPRSLQFQLDRLRAAGFRRSDVLHKHGPFAAFGAIK